MKLKRRTAEQALYEIGAVLAQHNLLLLFAREFVQQPPVTVVSGRRNKADKLQDMFSDESLPPAVRWGIKPGKALNKFHLLAADATGTMKRVRKEAIRNLEHKPGANPERTVRGLLARTKGQSRPRFMAELLQDTPREHHFGVLGYAALFYERIGEKASPRKLMAEAKLAGYSNPR